MDIDDANFSSHRSAPYSTYKPSQPGSALEGEGERDKEPDQVSEAAFSATMHDLYYSSSEDQKPTVWTETRTASSQVSKILPYIIKKLTNGSKEYKWKKTVYDEIASLLDLGVLIFISRLQAKGKWPLTPK
jgi:hypothetical protein